MYFNRADLPNILVVCGRNKRRSRTAESVYKNDMRFNIRSAGLSPSSPHQLSLKDLEWADLVLVMEEGQRKRIWDAYPNQTIPTIEILHIEDDYEFMDEELVTLLTDGIEDVLLEWGV